MPLDLPPFQIRIHHNLANRFFCFAYLSHESEWMTYLMTIHLIVINSFVLNGWSSSATDDATAAIVFFFLVHMITMLSQHTLVLVCLGKVLIIMRLVVGLRAWWQLFSILSQKKNLNWISKNIDHLYKYWKKMFVFQEAKVQPRFSAIFGEGMTLYGQALFKHGMNGCILALAESKNWFCDANN